MSVNKTAKFYAFEKFWLATLLQKRQNKCGRISVASFVQWSPLNSNRFCPHFLLGTSTLHAMTQVTRKNGAKSHFDAWVAWYTRAVRTVLLLQWDLDIPLCFASRVQSGADGAWNSAVFESQFMHCKDRILFGFVFELCGGFEFRRFWIRRG